MSEPNGREDPTDPPTDEHAMEIEPSDDGFVYFRMIGDRFDAPGMPADAVDSVQRFAQLIYAVARAKWIDENPGRQRAVPIRRAFDLRLVGIKEGSARPIFKLHMPTYDEGLEDEDTTPFFLRARDTVIAAVESVATDNRLTPEFPRAAMDEFVRFSKTVKEGEAIALSGPRPRSVVTEPTDPPTLDASVSETIKAINDALGTEPDFQYLEGVVTELDGARGSFRLRDTEGRVHTCQLGSQENDLADLVKEVLAADGVTAPDVRVGGSGVVDRRGRIGDLVDVSEVVVVRPAGEKALMTKLKGLQTLEPGWWGPGSRAPGPVALRHVEHALPRLAGADVHIALGANGDGAVVLEWRRDRTEFSAEIEPDGGLYLFADHLERGDVEESERQYDEDVLMRFVHTGVIDG